jgi:hypothetical protein
VDLINDLPDEERAEEVDESAEERFRQQVSGALHTLITLGELRMVGKEEVTQMQRRSVIDWCCRFAKEGPWRSIRSYKVWTRFVPLPEIGMRLEVAVRAELFTQLNYRPLAELTQTKFARLCEQYGIGSADRAQGTRVVVLTPDYLDSLLADPNQATRETRQEGGDGA